MSVFKKTISRTRKSGRMFEASCLNDSTSWKAKVALMTTKISGGNNNSAALDGQASTTSKEIAPESKVVKQTHIVRENNYMTITGNYKLKPKTKKDIIKYFDHHNREVVHLSYRVRKLILH